MTDLVKKVSFLQGMVEGMGIGEESKEGKILLQIMEVLEEVVDTVEALQADQCDLQDYVESIDDDVAELEDEVFNCGRCREDDDDEDEYIEMDCPECGTEVCFPADILSSEETIEVKCPNCDYVLFVNDGSYDLEVIDEDEEEDESEEDDD